MANLDGGLPPYKIPPHLVDLDYSHRWVESTQEGRWHFLPDHCRFPTIIDVENRAYRDTDPPEDQMCELCKPKWRKHVKASQKRA